MGPTSRLRRRSLRWNPSSATHRCRPSAASSSNRHGDHDHQPWSGFLFADWQLTDGNFNSVAKKNINYIYTLTFDAPSGFVFDPALKDAKTGIQVSNDGGQSKLIYRLHLKALPGSR